jgi:nucleolar GTP-binding protein
MSRGRALSVAKPTEGQGLKDAAQRNKAIKMGDRAQRRMGKAARKGEADRHIPNLRPKHLFSGKRGNGKTDRR